MSRSFHERCEVFIDRPLTNTIQIIRVQAIPSHFGEIHQGILMILDIWDVFPHRSSQFNVDLDTLPEHNLYCVGEVEQRK